MRRLLNLCLWQVVIIGMLSWTFSVQAQESVGISIRRPKAVDKDPLPNYGPIVSTDTLWNIALKVRPETNLTVYQVMQALYLTNPHAFAQENINHLIEGQLINIPHVDVMRSVSDRSAKIKAKN